MKTKYVAPILIGAGIGLALYSCGGGIPKNAQAVTNFDGTKYLGKWYEIARLDYKWERDLDNVTAEYSLNEDKTIKVDNKGYNVKKDKWEQSVGKLDMSKRTILVC